jgi:hypothetical protein
MGADQQAGFMGSDPTGLAYTYALPSYKKETNSTPQTCSMDRTLAEEGTVISLDIVLPVLWRGQGTHNEDVPSHDPKAKGNC